MRSSSLVRPGIGEPGRPGMHTIQHSSDKLHVIYGDARLFWLLPVYYFRRDHIEDFISAAGRHSGQTKMMAQHKA